MTNLLKIKTKRIDYFVSYSAPSTDFNNETQTFEESRDIEVNTVVKGFVKFKWWTILRTLPSIH